MSKYCKPMGLYVTYLDCMECEDKECITKREEQTNVNMGEQSQTKIAKSVPCCTMYGKCELTERRYKYGINKTLFEHRTRTNSICSIRKQTRRI